MKVIAGRPLTGPTAISDVGNRHETPISRYSTSGLSFTSGRDLVTEYHAGWSCRATPDHAGRSADIRRYDLENDARSIAFPAD